MAPKGVKWLLPGLLLALLTLAQPGLILAQSIDPSEVTETIADGGSIEITKTVTTPDIPPDADICFLADTTGSMGPALASVAGSIGGIMADVLVESPDAQFCAAQYKDAGSSPVFALDQALTTDTTAVQAAIGGWTAGGGGDFAEDQLHALTEVAGAATGWRAAPAAHILVWFGDCPGHDPASGGETLATTIDALTTSGRARPSSSSRSPSPTRPTRNSARPASSTTRDRPRRSRPRPAASYSRASTRMRSATRLRQPSTPSRSRSRSPW